MNDWLPPFCEQLGMTTDFPLFVEAANLLNRVWPAMITWHGWIADPVSPGTVGISAEPEDPYECGAPSLVSISSGPT
jgi:hypothetical protein